MKGNESTEHTAALVCSWVMFLLELGKLSWKTWSSGMQWRAVSRWALPGSTTWCLTSSPPQNPTLWELGMGWGEGCKQEEDEENLMWFRGADKRPASISTERSTYKARGIHLPQILLQCRTAVSRGFCEEGCDPRILCSAKLSLMCENMKKTLLEMQWFRKSAAFLCCLETALRCILAD